MNLKQLIIDTLSHLIETDAYEDINEHWSVTKFPVHPFLVFFVSVDPERDAEKVLGEHGSWVPSVIGVTGSREDADSIIGAFHIYAARVPLDRGDYTMDDSAMIPLFDERGRYQATSGSGKTPTARSRSSEGSSRAGPGHQTGWLGSNAERQAALACLPPSRESL